MHNATATMSPNTADSVSEKGLRKLLRQIGRISTCGALVCLPFSHFLTNQFIIVATIIGIITLSKSQLRSIKQQPFNMAIFAFLLLAALSIGYSSANLHTSLTWFFKYTKLLYIPVLAILFAPKRWQNIAIYAFIAAQFANMLLVLSLTKHWLAIQHIPHALSHMFSIPGTAMINIVPLSAQVGCATMLSAYVLIKNNNRIYQASMLIVIAALCYELGWILHERTGILVALVSTLYLISRRVSLNKAIIAASIAILIFIGAYFSSPYLQYKFNGILHIPSMLTNSIHPDAVDSSKNSSIRYRVEFAKHAWLIIKNNPVLGTGVGSFAKEYAKTNGPTLPGKSTLPDPHNAYILTTAQLGFVGLAVLLSLLCFLWRHAKKVNQLTLQAVIVAFLVNSACNMTFTNAASGVLFVTLFGILAAGRQEKSTINAGHT